MFEACDDRVPVSLDIGSNNNPHRNGRVYRRGFFFFV
jgi:hypothetical protein